MAISNGSAILASDLNGIWETALDTLRSRTDTSNLYKQFSEVFRFDGITSSTAEYLRTIVYVPRTDVILRGVRIYCATDGANLPTATVTIPAQIIEDNNIVGGNIKSTLTASATASASSNFANSTNRVVLSNTELFTFLAGDNIDIIVSLSGAITSPPCNVTVVCLFENVLTG